MAKISEKKLQKMGKTKKSVIRIADSSAHKKKGGCGKKQDLTPILIRYARDGAV
ncbi:MAG: hypothetical protein JSV96_01390 [Candidatus Aminicenantes bacterium]|nr:MAG: hypothetical protein JSV96_01390 [Candidatus Aminicenantes bacterium]